MPTPVSVARLCLTDEAARALDDAVLVARRRCHAQTTSVHAVSALLALPSSSLREACGRARSSAYSPRLQFRALELCVGVSLDRLPSSKSVDEPPISNSLMAAIKRSQANQRRHPESFHLHQIHTSQQNVSVLKVELKNFILSILDDPIVSRVFGDAGFRRCDIKLGIVHPPLSHSSRFSRTRLPPIFLCNWSESEPRDRNFSFPYTFGTVIEDGEENIRRIGEVLVRKHGRNPLLVGVCASDALLSFVECVQRGKSGVLPAEVAGLNVVSIGKEISESIEGGSEEKIGLKFKELNHAAEDCTGPGIIVNFGELKPLIGDSATGASVIAQLTSLFKLHSEKLWLIGVVGTHETFVELLAQFPTIEKDWDIHLLQITTSHPSIEATYPKSSLLGSFVPFGGFFSTPSDFKNPLNITSQSFTSCHMCTEKYEQEVASILKVRSNISVADQYSESISSWLKMAELDTTKGIDMTKTKDDETLLNSKIIGLKKKWNDICHRYHHSRQFTKVDTSQANSQDTFSEDFQLVGNRIQSSSKESSLTEIQCGNLSPRMDMDLRKDFLPKQNVSIPLALASESDSCNFESKLAVEVSISKQVVVPPYSLNSLSLPLDCKASLSLTSVTTDLVLGTPYASARQEPNSPKLEHHKERLCHFSGSDSTDFDVMPQKTLSQMGVEFDAKDFKLLREVLSEKIGWQDEAIFTISQVISRCRARNLRHCDSNLKGNIWLTFLGHDKVGKKRTASALAETLFGNKGSLISLDLSSQDSVTQSNSIFECKKINSCDVKFRGKTVVDYVAGELIERPHSLVFLENVDKADLLVQSSLSQAIRTGKFPDSHGREISINNMIFVATSTTITKDNRDSTPGKELFEISEERVLGARNWQMQILVESVARDGSRRSGMNVKVTTQKSTPNPSNVSKRKMTDTSGSGKWQRTLEIHKLAHEVPRSYLDLNLPVELEEDAENSETWLEDFFNQVDAKVHFKPFNFDKLAEKLLNTISVNFQKTLGPDIQLAIDHEVMLQLLAATWLSERDTAMEEWIEQVLNRSFIEIQWRYHLNAQTVLKLIPCEGSPMQDQAPGLRLPAKINLH